MSEWSLNPILERNFGNISYYLVALLALGLLLTWVVGFRWTASSLKRRSIISALRLATIVLIILAMLRPARVFIETKQLPSTLIILIDKSRSMSIEDAVGDKTRWEVLEKMFAELAPDLNSLGDNVELQVYAFDAEAMQLAVKDGKIALPKTPDGQQTDHGTSMRDVLRREDGKRLIGFIIAGDGAQQTREGNTAPAQSAARALNRLQCPLLAISFGTHRSRQQARDIVLETMPDNLSVYVKNELSVSGTVRVSGYVGQDIPIQLVVESESGKSEVVATTSVRANQDDEQLRYELSYIPEEAGEYQIAVKVVPQSGELTTSNNEIPTYLSVREGGLRVLYLQGELRLEQRFLRRALAASPDIEIELRTIHTRDRDQWPVKGMRPLFKPDTFDAYILGDVDSAAFSVRDLALLRDSVREGAGLIMLGGWHSFWPGGYQKTPLRNIMPLKVDPDIDNRSRQRFEDFIPPDLHIEGPIKMLPTPMGDDSFVMRLGPREDNLAIWEELPPLAGANRLGGASENGFVLAETEEGDPLLIAGEPGGRVLAFAADSTWRWVMQGYESEHRRFWRQVVLWLAQHDKAAKGSTRIHLDGRRFAPGAPVTFAASTYSAEGEAIADAQWQAKVTLPDGSVQTMRLARKGDEMHGQFLQTDLPGEYVVEVSAEKDGKPLGSADSQFLVYEKDFELSGPTADRALLASLADKTKEFGGRMIVPEEVPEFLKEIAKSAEKFEAPVIQKINYWDRPWFFGLIVLLLSVEWFLRKRWRLV